MAHVSILDIGKHSGETLKIKFLDGETVIARLEAVFDEEGEFLLDINWTSEPQKYQRFGQRSGILARVQDVLSIDAETAASG